MREFLRYIITKYTVFLYLGSTLLILIAILLPKTGWTNFLSEILKIFGAGAFITTLVSSILNFHFQTDINRYFSIIRGVERSGIKRIYENREEALIEIDSEFEKAHGAIELLYISGTDFLHSNILAQLDKMCFNNSNNKVRILLLDPRSKHAVDRSLIEEGINLAKTDILSIDYPHATLCGNTLYSLEQLERIMKDKQEKNRENFEIQIRTYDTAPILFLVRVNDKIFVEQYHYGITEEDRQTSLTTCLGKKVPVTEFRPNSLTAQLWMSHFDYLWETSSDREVRPGFKHLLEKTLREDKVWSILYDEIRTSSKKSLGKFGSGTSDNTG